MNSVRSFRFPLSLLSRRLVVACAIGCLSPLAMAQQYPSRPVTLVSPLPAGASTDVVTRAWMQCASVPSRAAQPFVLQNKPGANGVVAAQSVRTVANDGYTIMVAGMSATVITPFTFKKMPFDPEQEFEGAAIFGTSDLVLVANAQSGIKSVQDLQAAAKKAPKGVDIGIPGIGSPAHLLSAAVAAKLGMPATLVPVVGEPGGVTALLGDQFPAMVFLTGSAAQYIDGGKFVPLMTFTEKRLPQYPQVPTVVEVLGDSEMVRSAWIGITTKRGSPPEVARSLDTWTQECLGTPEFKQALTNAMFTPHYVGRAQYAEQVKKDIAFFKPWIDRLGIRND